MTFGFQQKVVDLVCDTMGVDKKRLFVPDRRRRIILAKHITMYILKKRYGYTFGEIGRMFTVNGEKKMHHTSVMHGYRSIQNGLDIKDDVVVIPYNEVIKRLDNMLARKINTPGRLVVTFAPDFNIDGVIAMLKRNYKELEYEKK